MSHGLYSSHTFSVNKEDYQLSFDLDHNRWMDFLPENKQNVKGCTVSKINSAIRICLENDD